MIGSSKKNGIVIAGAALIISIGLILFGFNVFGIKTSEQRQFDQAKTSGNTAIGTIVDSVTEIEYRREYKGPELPGGKPRPVATFCPLYEFTDPQGSPHRFADLFDCEQSEYLVEIGATAPVVFVEGGLPAFTDTQTTRDILAFRSMNIYFIAFGGTIGLMSLMWLIANAALRHNPKKSRYESGDGTVASIDDISRYRTENDDTGSDGSGSDGGSD